ncbi:hypothetical protein [Flammeovirga kamogawensis]|uniref:DUF4783 domain-containing protein n=1 Tax=Flammeovirga kamogawensis TaxID=373891 RepID=A0ABX8H1Q5_9BACT|nr:hypothetical protein [Flammeovirga kamogawensis]MBB6463601.1 hypothetical protein [Flammeovirga kamogawensis]QWG09826.1 hypothetical protein KM029_19285 [Flammeovirga kamogawensis]TRX65333.1 hypothetical protein EO216_22685 [Flammeovirga kamogawensis]
MLKKIKEELVFTVKGMFYFIIFSPVLVLILLFYGEYFDKSSICVKNKVLNREFNLDQVFKEMKYYKYGNSYGFYKRQLVGETNITGDFTYSYQVVADKKEYQIIVHAVIHKNKWYLMDLVVYKTPHRFFSLLLSKGELILHDKYDTLEGSKNYIIDCPL